MLFLLCANFLFDRKTEVQGKLQQSDDRQNQGTERSLLLAVLISLLAASLQRATDLSMVMDNSCYTGDSWKYGIMSGMVFTWRDT